MEMGICRRCSCNWVTPCINEKYGPCWWVDKNRTLCSHCFYGLNRIYREEIPKWQEIIGNNMIFYNAKVNDSKHYASSLPRKYKHVD